jgi:hypothetical protein
MAMEGETLIYNSQGHDSYLRDSGRQVRAQLLGLIIQSIRLTFIQRGVVRMINDIVMLYITKAGISNLTTKNTQELTISSSSTVFSMC